MTIPQVSGYGNFMYPYYAYTPQFNNWNNYRYSTPVFRGTEPQPAMQQPLKQDTVQISAEKEIKTNKKEGLSTGAKWAIGLATTAAAVYGSVVLHRHLTRPSIEKVSKNFSEIFRRDVSKEEALKITEKYKEIFKIKDKDEFCQKIFEQVKKDYGYGNVPISFQNFTREGINGACNVLHNRIEAKFHNKKQFLKTMIHEFQHLKQYEYSYRTDKKMLVDAFYERILKQEPQYLDDILKLNNLSKNTKNINEIKIEIKNKIEKQLNNLFRDRSIFNKNSENYKQGLKYINNEANYISFDVDAQGYLKQLIEKEAFGTAPLVKEFYNFFANPWRIF